MNLVVSTPCLYPRTVNTDFRKLPNESLLRLASFYGLEVEEQFQKEELAIRIAKRFESQRSQETEVIDKFAAQYCYSNSEVSQNRKRLRSNRESLLSEPARVGEQVAVRVTQGGSGNGGGGETMWILANVLSFDASSQTYVVQDEDDGSNGSNGSNPISLGSADVRRLEDSASHLRRGDAVLAVFPETTSFYSGVLLKNPRNYAGSLNGSVEVFVRFEDDEDETGKPPPRRVPAKFVMRRSDAEAEDDDEDDDNNE